jgi:hypothetical protein
METIHRSLDGASPRKFKIGDDVTVNMRYCERHKKDGKVIAVSKDPKDSMPYMVRFSDFGEWPFAESELLSFEEQ